MVNNLVNKQSASIEQQARAEKEKDLRELSRETLMWAEHTGAANLGKAKHSQAVTGQKIAPVNPGVGFEIISYDLSRTSQRELGVIRGLIHFCACKKLSQRSPIFHAGLGKLFFRQRKVSVPERIAPQESSESRRNQHAPQR